MAKDPVPGLAGILNDGRQYVLDSVAGLDDSQARRKPAPERWSVLECMEHIATVEDRFLGWILNGREGGGPERSWERQTKLFSMVTDRSTKVQAPEAVVPTGRFASLEEAIDAFTTARARTIDLHEKFGQDLYQIGATHPRFGDVNGADVMHLIAGHARRHADQIRETREALG